MATGKVAAASVDPKRPFVSMWNRVARSLFSSLAPSCPVTSCLLFSCPLLFRRSLSCLVLSRLVPSPLLFSALVPCSPVTSCLLFSCPLLSRHILPSLPLSCLLLSSLLASPVVGWVLCARGRETLVNYVVWAPRPFQNLGLATPFA